MNLEQNLFLLGRNGQKSQNVEILLWKCRASPCYLASQVLSDVAIQCNRKKSRFPEAITETVNTESFIKGNFFETGSFLGKEFVPFVLKLVGRLWE